MRKNINTTKVIGRVYSFGEANGRNMLELKVSGERSKNPGTEFISGVVNVAVDEAGCNVIPVHFTYVTATYAKSGKPNPNFTTLKKLIETGKTWVKDGKDQATAVTIDGSLGLNDFFVEENGEDKLISTKSNEGSFISILNEELPAEDDRSKFTCDMIITKITHVDADEEKGTTDHVVVRGAAFNFQNSLLPCDFIVRNPAGVAYFDSIMDDVSSSEPFYTKVWGKIHCETKVTTVTEESAFGEAAVRSYEKKTREWVITGLAKEEYAFGDENVITAEELTKAMQDREVYLADIKKRSEDYKAQKNNGGMTTATTTTATAPKAKVGGFNF